MTMLKRTVFSAVFATVFDCTFGMQVDIGVRNDENFPSEIAGYTINSETNIDKYNPSLLRFSPEEGMRSINLADIAIGGDFLLLTDIGQANISVSPVMNLQEVGGVAVKLNGITVRQSSSFSLGVKGILFKFLSYNHPTCSTFPVGDIHFSLWDPRTPEKLFLQRWPTGYKAVDDVLYRKDLYLVVSKGNKWGRANINNIKDCGNFVFYYGDRKSNIYISQPPERNVWKFHQSRIFLGSRQGQEITPGSVLGRAIHHAILTAIAWPKMDPELLKNMQKPVYEGNITLPEGAFRQIWQGIYDRLFRGKWIRISAVGDEERRNITMNDLKQGGDFIFRINKGTEILTFPPLCTQNINNLEMLWNGKKLDPLSIWGTLIKDKLLSYLSSNS